MSRSTFFSSLDVGESVRDIARAASHHRLNNFYDVGPKLFVMRFGAADSKHRVVFEPGVRIHMTDVDHEKPKLPSHFTLMMRKYIRGWRLFSVAQVGHDRVVDFAFGSGDTPQYHVFVELWGQGNIVLCDGDCKIMAFWRTPKKGENMASSNFKQIGDTYDTSLPPITAGAAAATSSSASESSSSARVQITEQSTLAALQQLVAHKAGGGKAEPVGSIFPGATVYGPALLKHISVSSGIDLGKPLSAAAADKLEATAQQLARAFAEVDAAYSAAAAPGGFVYCSVQKQDKDKAAEEDSASKAVGFQNVAAFSKLPLKQFSNAAQFTCTPTPTFSAAADALYTAEERKRLADLAKKQQTAHSREERCRAAIHRRITELESEGAQRRRCADALLLACEEVDKVIQLIGDALALGTPWKALTDAIRRQREAAENPGKEASSSHQKKSGAAAQKDGGDDDDDDDAFDMGGDDEEDEEDAFMMDSDEDDVDDDDDGSEDDDDDGRDEAARAADEQRYLLSLIYALDLRRNQMTLQLPDPEAAFDEDGEDEDDDEDNNDNAPSTNVILVVVDLGLSSHENATRYFELAKKADKSKQKTADREEDAVASAKKSTARGSGHKKDKKTQAAAPKHIAAAERTPTWFERYQWFVSSAGDLVVTPKDAGQADVLMTKFATLEFDAVVMHDADASGCWPTLVKPRACAHKLLADHAAATGGAAAAAAESPSAPVMISTASLREAGAASVCRSSGWSQKSAPKAFWCAAAALSKTTPGTKDKPLPQGLWFCPNEARTPLEVFSLQLCVAVVEARSVPLEESDFEAASSAAKVALNSKLVAGGASSATPKQQMQQQQQSSAQNKPQGKKQQQQQGKKQQQQHQQATNDDDEDDDNASEAAMSRSNTTTSMASSKAGGGKNNQQQQQNQDSHAAKRQQRKAKLIQKKYGEQDEEDRAIALALIGAKKSKALDLIDEIPAPPPPVVGHSKKREKKNKQQKEEEHEGGDDAAAAESPSPSDAAPPAAPAPAAEDPNAAKKPQGKQQQKPPRVGGGKPGGGAMTEDAAKNLADKIATGASEWLSMRVVGLSPLAAETADSPSVVRFVAPVCIPVLAMPTNKVRVLIVPGGEKRNGLTQEIAKSFFGALAAHVEVAVPSLAAAVRKVPNDELLQQLPMTGKVMTPFRASMVPLPKLEDEKQEEEKK